MKKKTFVLSPESVCLANYIADRAIQQNISSDELECRLIGLFSPGLIHAASDAVSAWERHCDKMHDDIMSGFIKAIETWEHEIDRMTAHNTQGGL